MQSSVVVDVGRQDKLAGDELLVDYAQRYRPLVERLCRMLLGDSTEAEDAAQQTFLLAYQSLLAGTRPRQPRAWLCTIARRECWARADRRRRERAVSAEVAPELDPSERAVLREELATIAQGLEQLPLRQRQAIVLRELAGLSYVQLAAVLDVSESAAEALLVRARRSLRQARLILLLPFPRSVRRLLRHTLPAKAVAAATVVTVTAAVGGAAMPADRAAQPAVPIATGVRASQPASAVRPVSVRTDRRKAGPIAKPKPKPRPSVRHTARSAAVARAEVARAPVSSAPVTTEAASLPEQLVTSKPKPKPTPEHASPPSRPPAPKPHPQPAAPTPSDPPPAAPLPDPPAPPAAPPADDPGDTQSQPPDTDRGTVDGQTPGADPNPPAAQPDPPGQQHDPPGKR
jgi:RNA polymerase sigma-70 factor, ECF subfamily